MIRDCTSMYNILRILQAVSIVSDFSLSTTAIKSDRVSLVRANDDCNSLILLLQEERQVPHTQPVSVTTDISTS